MRPRLELSWAKIGDVFLFAKIDWHSSESARNIDMVLPTARRSAHSSKCNPEGLVFLITPWLSKTKTAVNVDSKLAEIRFTVFIRSRSPPTWFSRSRSAHVSYSEKAFSRESSILRSHRTSR